MPFSHENHEEDERTLLRLWIAVEQELEQVHDSCVNLAMTGSCVDVM